MKKHKPDQSAQKTHHSQKLSPDVNENTIIELRQLINTKLTRIQSILQNTMTQLNVYRGLNIISGSDVIVCTTTIIECYDKTNVLLKQLAEEPKEVSQINAIIDDLQQIIDKLSIIMCGYGTKQLEDIFFISFGQDIHLKAIENPVWRAKTQLILQHLRPTGYKTIHWKQSRNKPRVVSEQGAVPPTNYCTNKIVEEVIQVELANQYECFDIDFSGKPIFVKINGIRAVFHNEKTQKTIIVQGIVDNVPLECITNAFVDHRKKEILDNLPASETFQLDILQNMLNTMTIKDTLIYGNEDIYKKQIALLTEVNYVKFNKLNTTIKKFLDMDTYNQRAMLMNLLIYNREEDIQYITYLLYDLISAKSAGNNSATDSAEQQLMYDSFPWRVKLFFKETMKNTIKYTKDVMSRYDINRVSLEQQIFVLKAPENVREKAMNKLKEVKGKTDDSGAKAKQYLEGLLKIPFAIFREEPLLKKTKQMNALFHTAMNRLQAPWWSPLTTRQQNDHLTVAEMSEICQRFFAASSSSVIDHLQPRLDRATVKQISAIFSTITEQLHANIKKTATPKHEKIAYIKEHLRLCPAETVASVYDCLELGSSSESTSPTNSLTKTLQDMHQVHHMIDEMEPSIQKIMDVLDESIHGHLHAKRQILKIISQWMNGEQTGYCFGFEGSPGIGKTSLAKRGLSKCLQDEHGTSRPFAFIALGGSCNGSTLEGHSYTYVNSTWGRIVDVLMDAKCMNPIIYIDELDKVSKTEHGKEIIGILMHLIDTTQNSGFQDKYFSGIDIDLSKALFIFSYNDPSQIDSILLDRIHRIKFDHLSLEEKIVIVRNYMLPEITTKMGLVGAVELTDEIIEHIIETYTLESGVRKLKEVMFDLHGEINVTLLQASTQEPVVLPLHITVEDLDTKYLTKYDKIKRQKIHTEHEVGVVNGLWANALGRGGIIPIQTMFFPSQTFLDLKLTGMQGDVMKESMNVAKSLAWSLLTDEERGKCLAKFEKTKEQGLHIHCPEGAVSKDGPSAGAAITVAIYSLLSGRPVNSTVAMTGEINLQGKITEIGGLEHKIAGGIRAGIRKFLYPVENSTDFEKWVKKTGPKPYLQGIEFVQVSTIEETFAHFFV